MSYNCEPPMPREDEPAPAAVKKLSSNYASSFSIVGNELSYNGRTILTEVPCNISLSPYASVCLDTPILCASEPSDGAFLGFRTSHPDCRHVTSLGKLRDTKFVSIFRFKLWWTTQWVGDKGSDLETETQMLLLDTKGKATREGIDGYPYILLLPICEGKFRASLEAGSDDNVDVCVESGSTVVCESSFQSCVYLHACHDPFLLMKDAVRALHPHLRSFEPLEDKVPPSIVNKFGWCTWDAFYLTVHPEGIWDAMKGFVEGAVPPSFLIIDDGWQSIGFDHQDPSEDATHQTIAGDQMWCRLTNIGENVKFRAYTKGTLRRRHLKYDNGVPCNGIIVDEDLNQQGKHQQGMGAFVRDLKEEYTTLEDVYVWHALTGYWGGVRPGLPNSFDAKLVQPVLAPGILETMEDLAVEKIVKNTIGLVPPEKAHSFFDALHSYLAKSGITGVKIDVIHCIPAALIASRRGNESRINKR